MKIRRPMSWWAERKVLDFCLGGDWLAFFSGLLFL